MNVMCSEGKKPNAEKSMHALKISIFYTCYSQRLSGFLNIQVSLQR